MRTLEPRPGQSIQEAAERAVILANETDELVIADFNGVELKAKPGDKPSNVVKRWRKEADVQQREYENSPEGRRAALEAELLCQERQKKLDDAMIELPKLDFNNFEVLITWLGNIQESTDHIGINRPYEKIVSIFRKHGYKPNVNCGNNFDGEDKENFARYLIGQALECLRGPVHAIHGIFQEHARQWREKFCK